MTNTDVLMDRPLAADPAPRPRRVRASRRRDVTEVVALVAVLLVLCAVFSAISPGRFATATNLRTILDQASVPLIIGIGATFVILMGSIDLSVEGVMGAAGMTFVLMIPNSRSGADSGFLSVVVALAVGAGMGLATGLLHTLLKVPSFIVTLGMWYVGLGIATVLFGDASIPFIKSQALDTWPSDTSLGLPHSILLAAGVLVIGVLVSRYTRLGRMTYAIGDNEAIARSNGIRVNRFKVAVFAIAGLCSGLAGILATLQLGAGSATVGIGNLFLTIPAVVIGGTALSGGRGGVLRTALGVVLLTTLNNGLIISGVSANIRSGVSGAILIVAIIAAAWSKRDRLAVSK